MSPRRNDVVMPDPAWGPIHAYCRRTNRRLELVEREGQTDITLRVRSLATGATVAEMSVKRGDDWLARAYELVGLEPSS